MKVLNEYKEDHKFVFIFENGKGVKVPVSAYETKSNRRKLTGAYSSASPIVAVFYEDEPFELLMVSDSGKKGIVINTKLITEKTTRTSQGTSLYKLKPKQTVENAYRDFETRFEGAKKCRKIKVPATPSTLE